MAPFPEERSTNPPTSQPPVRRFAETFVRHVPTPPRSWLPTVRVWTTMLGVGIVLTALALGSSTRLPNYVALVNWRTTDHPVTFPSVPQHHIAAPGTPEGSTKPPTAPAAAPKPVTVPTGGPQSDGQPPIVLPRSAPGGGSLTTLPFVRNNGPIPLAPQAPVPKQNKPAPLSNHVVKPSKPTTAPPKTTTKTKTTTTKPAKPAPPPPPPKPAPTQKTAPPHGYLLVNIATGQCVDLANGSNAPGTPVLMFRCTHNPGQQWHFITDKTIRSLGRCMDVAGSSTADGAPIRLFPCNGTSAQQFALTPAHDLVYLRAGKCVTMNGIHLQIRPCTGSPNQKWGAKVA